MSITGVPYPHNTTPGRNFSPDLEKTRMLKEKDELIRKFLVENVYDSSGKLEKSVKVKTYQDGAKYEGQLSATGKVLIIFKNIEKK